LATILLSQHGNKELKFINYYFYYYCSYFNVIGVKIITTNIITAAAAGDNDPLLLPFSRYPLIVY